jgi:hypothetical protein
MQTEKVKRQPPTAEQIRKQQKADAEKALPVPTNSNATALAMPDTRTDVQRYLDEIAPASIVGRLVKFTKDGQFATSDDGTVIGDSIDFIALVDQTLIGWVKFGQEGEPPERHMGLLYDGFVMPPRDSLGDLNRAKWEIGLDGQPADPWQHHVYLVLQRGDTSELFTFATSSMTGRRAIGTLLRHYDRIMQRARSGEYPVIRLKVGGFQHRDDRVGWVKVPVLAVVGRAPKDGTATPPDTSLKADLNDEIGF